LVIFEPQARVVRLIFDWYLRGDGSSAPLSIRGITNKLSAACIPSRSDGDPSMIMKRRGRGKWNRTSVRNILRRETYAGTWHYGKRGSKGNTKVWNPRETWLALEVPAIISRDTWEAAQEQLKRNSLDSPRNLKREYLLRRRAYCGSCGCKLYVTQTQEHRGTYRYYHCPAAGGYQNYATQCDQRKRFRADHTDAATWDWVRSLLLHPEATLEGMRQMQASREEAITPLRDRLSAIEGQIVDNERQLARLLDLFLSDDDFPRELLTERKSRLQDKIKSLERERAELDAEIKSQASSEEQMQTVLQFTERIRDGLEAAEEDFSMRRQIIEVLDLTARMAIEDAEKVVYVKCLMSEDRLSIASTPSRGGSPITQ